MLVEGFPVIFDAAHLAKALTFHEDNRLWTEFGVYVASLNILIGYIEISYTHNGRTNRGSNQF